MNSKYNNLKDQNAYRQWAASLSDEELSFCIGRYCGPSNQILREKEFGRTLGKELSHILNEELLSREIDKMLAN